MGSAVYKKVHGRVALEAVISHVWNVLRYELAARDGVRRCRLK